MQLSKERKKELQEQYKLMKPEMGIFAVINKSSSKYYLQVTQNLKGMINSTRFKLDGGMHPNKELQKDWLEIGSDGFEIRVLEKIEYDEDESKTDYTEELELLKMMWVDKLTGNGITLY
ncbi:MAG TPA: GIY-YIG nuclease family protein [Syntrophomonadaceae bacterium]|nr:GIY-YIG nuclease family protein [Syntrophomonadaceae bacterium]